MSYKQPFESVQSHPPQLARRLRMPWRTSVIVTVRRWRGGGNRSQGLAPHRVRSTPLAGGGRCFSEISKWPGRAILPTGCSRLKRPPQAGGPSIASSLQKTFFDSGPFGMPSPKGLFFVPASVHIPAKGIIDASHNPGSDSFQPRP